MHRTHERRREDNRWKRRDVETDREEAESSGAGSG